jgi:hypothetical protein
MFCENASCSLIRFVSILHQSFLVPRSRQQIKLFYRTIVHEARQGITEKNSFDIPQPTLQGKARKEKDYFQRHINMLVKVSNASSGISARQHTREQSYKATELQGLYQHAEASSTTLSD